MADDYNTLLKDVSAPSSPRMPSVGSAQITQSPLATGLEGAAKIFVGGATLFDKAQGSEVIKQVDKNIETAFQDSLGVSSDGFINSTLDNLEKLKMAQEQGKDTGDRFYISLVKSSRELKNKYPNRIGEIDKAMKERGLVDPRLSLIQTQMNREEEVRQAQNKRETELLDKAYKDGWAVHSVPGDKTSPIDKNATIRLAGDMAANEMASARIAKALGIVRDSKGEVSFTMRDEFVRNLPELRQIMWTNGLTGIRPDLDAFQKMVSNATERDLPELKKALLGIVGKKDQFMLQAQSDAIKYNLNEKEKEIYMANAKEMIGGLTNGILDVENINDINTMKSIGKLYQFASDNAKLMNFTDAPVMSRMALIAPQLVERAVNLSKFDKNFDLTLGKNIGLELNKIISFTPPKPKPTSGDIDLTTSEDNKSREDKVHRLKEAVTWQQNFINSGVAVKDDDTATGYSWIATQAPLFNAYTRGLDGNGVEKLSANDKASIVKQMTTANYISNLKTATKQYPDKGAMIGQYAYNMVTDHVVDQLRALRNTSTTFQKFGEDYTLKYDLMQGKFVLAQPSLVGKSPGYIASTTRANDPEILNRLAQINASIPLLMEARKSNPNTAGMKDGEYLTSLIGLVNGDMMQQGGSPQGTTPFGTRPDGSPKGNGFLGVLKRPDGGVSTELSFDFEVDGQNISAPLLVPTLTKSEINHLLNDGEPTEAIYKKAQDHALKRIEEGKSPFAGPEDRVGSDMNDVVKRWENDQLKGRDQTGLWRPHKSLEGGTDTIGFGHKLTKEEQAGGYVNLAGQKVSFKDGLSDEQIDELLNQDMVIANNFVNKEFPDLAQNQKDAVASLVYNVGAAEFKSSKAYKALKAGNLQDFAMQAYDPKKGYVRINGKVSDGLVNRRNEEKEMFFADGTQYMEKAPSDTPKPGRKPTKFDMDINPLVQEYLERHPEVDLDMSRVGFYPGGLTVSGAYSPTGRASDMAKFLKASDKPHLAGQPDSILLAQGVSREEMVETLMHEGRHRAFRGARSKDPDIDLPKIRIQVPRKDGKGYNPMTLAEEDFVRLFDFMYNASDYTRKATDFWFNRRRGLNDLDLDQLYKNSEINDVLMYIQKQIVDRKKAAGIEVTNVNYPEDKYFEKFTRDKDSKTRKVQDIYIEKKK